MQYKFKENLDKYVSLLVRAGVNLQQGQILVVMAEVSSAPFVRLVAKEAYKAGAKEVVVRWSDEALSRLKYDYAPLSQYETVPDWFSSFLNGYAKEGAAFLTIDSADPNAMTGIDPAKPTAWAKASHRQCKAFYDSLDFGVNTWCIAAVPSPQWAKAVFPGKREEEAVDLLWDAIFKAVRVDTPDPFAAWKGHSESFEDRSRWLNAQQFKALHYKNSLGTDIVIGLPENHVWAGGGAKTTGGVFFFPNMPTEELFCTPHREMANGVVRSSMPLNYRGSLIEDFSLVFEKGRVVEFSARKGEDSLKAILSADEGARHLGEVALIPVGSPISRMDTIFYNTLFDENASCHFALGQGFAECLEGGLDMDQKALTEKGINESAVHVDFMLGTADLSITGVKASGEEVPVFRDGGWAF